MKKLFLILLIVPSMAQSATTSKTRAYLKISYGFAAVIAGIGCPIMGAYHGIAGRVLAKMDHAVDQVENQVKSAVGKRPFFQKFRANPWGKRLLSVAGKADQAVDFGIDAQVELQKISGRYYLINSLLLIPLGIAAIRSGLKDLNGPIAPPSEENFADNNIADDKEIKS